MADKRVWVWTEVIDGAVHRQSLELLTPARTLGTAEAVVLGPAALRCLSHYPWPGNVRELANLIERLAILQPDGQVGINDLPPKFRAHYPDEPTLTDVAPFPVTASSPSISSELVSLPPEGIDLRQHIIDLESSLIHSALEDANGVVAHAASLLKMRRTTLVEKMRKYNIKRGDVDE